MGEPDPVCADDLMRALETHDAEALGRLAAAGLSFAAAVRGKTPVQWLLEMYMRSPRFASCLRILLAHGGALPEPALAPVLLDEAETLRAALRANPGLLQRRFDMASAFTSLRGASLLHIAAEFGHGEATKALLAAGADADVEAADDGEDGSGHTPLFHTVASILDHGAPVMQLLLAAGARVDVRVPRLLWGCGFEWETTFYDVTPVSYCQAGLLPQVHRRETDVYRNLGALMAAARRPAPSLTNVPNRYLQPRAKP